MDLTLIFYSFSKARIFKVYYKHFKPELKLNMGTYLMGFDIFGFCQRSDPNQVKMEKILPHD
jgi:hypothetical protein